MKSLELDSEALAFSGGTDKTQTDIWLVGTDCDHKPYPYLQSRFNESWNAMSPDGRWMAYASDQPGQNEVLVESIPVGKGRWQISTEGGTWPVWRGDGKERFFFEGTKLMAAPIRLTETVESGKPQALFELPSEDARFQVSRDGHLLLGNYENRKRIGHHLASIARNTRPRRPGRRQEISRDQQYPVCLAVPDHLLGAFLRL